MRDEKVSKTPATPVSIEAFMTLQKIIVSQDANTLDEASKQNLKRPSEVSQSCTLIVRSNCNPEGPDSLKAKVISFEDFVGARMKRLEKEAAKHKTKARSSKQRVPKYPKMSRFGEQDSSIAG